jgi:glycosyltransferase involved in cell wall biosynthesis
MRIAFFTDVYQPTINGVVASISAYANHLRSRGHEVTIICPSYPDTEDEEGILRVRAITFPSYKEYRMASPISSKIERHMREHVYDIIHIHSPFAIGLSGIFYAKRFRIPVIYTAHTNYADYRHNIHGGSLIPESVIDKLAAKFSNGIDLTIAPSQKIVDSLIRYGTKTPIAVLPTGIDKPIPGNRAAFKERYDLDRAVNLLYLGRVAKEKNLDFVIRAFGLAKDKLHPKTRFMIVGDGPYRENLEKLVRELGLQERVIFTGFLSGQERADAYAGADIFCHASYSETQGMTLLEASSYGLALIVSDDTAYAGIAIAGVNALIAGPDEQEYADCIVQLATDTAMRHAFAAESQKIAKGYGMSEQTDELIKLYEEVIASKRLSIVYESGKK